MRRLLLSWFAPENDFLEPVLPIDEDTPPPPPAVNPAGPTMSLHKHYIDGHEKHILLSVKGEDDMKASRLLKALQETFPQHPIESRPIELTDKFAFRELKLRMSHLMQEFTDFDRIEVLFTNGTSAMRLAWVLIRLEREYYHRVVLIQGKAPQFNDGKSEFTPISLEIADVPHRIALWEPQRLSDDFIVPPGLERLYEQARRIAEVPLAAVPELNTLLLGPAGAGKNRLAQYVHAASVRKEKTYLRFRCAGGADDQLYARLFGRADGQGPAGAFAAANGGSLYLEEVHQLSLAIQVDLLEALTTRQYYPLGATAPIEFDIRIMAGSQAHLPDLCEKGQFRWDLFHRLGFTQLAVIPWEAYPLTDRQYLIDTLWDQYKQRVQHPQLVLHPKLREWLLMTDFPGQLGELKAILLHLAIFTQGDMAFAQDLPPAYHATAQQHDLSLKTLLSPVEKRHILRVYELMGRKKRPTAKALGMAYNTFEGRLKLYEADTAS